MTDKNELLLALLNQKVEVLNGMNEIGIIWWTTTIVFSATIIGLLWKEREDICDFPNIKMMKFAISSFYSSTILFGFWMVIIGHKLDKEYHIILEELKVGNKLMGNISFVGSQVAFTIGVCNFIVIFLLWLMFSKHLLNKNKDNN